MPLKNPRFAVAYTGDKDTPDSPVERRVVIRHGDRLRAELEMPKNGLPGLEKAPMHHTTCWVWAALVREGHYDKPFALFLRTDCIDLEGLDDDEEPDVDPTRAGSDSLSSSGTTGLPSTAG